MEPHPEPHCGFLQTDTMSGVSGITVKRAECGEFAGGGIRWSHQS